MTRLCQYANSLGVPGKGVHSIRIFNIAVVDLGLTVIAAYIFFKLTTKGKSRQYWIMDPRFWVILGVILLLGIGLHWLFCVNTTVNMMLFGKS